MRSIPINSLLNSSAPSQTQLLFQDLQRNLAKQVLGQPHLTNRLLVALIAGGHLLVEGAPGLAKTRAIKSLSRLIDSEFHRIQFTPDLLPADLTGTDIFQPELAKFSFQKGPLFHNIVLADEINRAPAKVQSALLEAMAEKQITIGRTTHSLPALFMVMATQNPIEQEGTYPLPEAQLDRFLLHVNVNYPDCEVEKQIMDLALAEAKEEIGDKKNKALFSRSRITKKQIQQAQSEALDIYLADSVKEYIIQLVLATRNAMAYDAQLASWIEYGASPRGSISLERVARAHAWLEGRHFVSPDDVQLTVHDTLRHRLLLSFSAQAEGITTDKVISKLLDLVAVI